jgi:hypothetical protein
MTKMSVELNFEYHNVYVTAMVKKCTCSALVDTKWLVLCLYSLFVVHHFQYFAGMALSFVKMMRSSSSNIFSITTLRRKRRWQDMTISLW